MSRAVTGSTELSQPAGDISCFFFLVFLQATVIANKQDSVCFMMINRRGCTPLYRLSLHNRIFIIFSLISLITIDPYIESMVMPNGPSPFSTTLTK